MIVLAFAGGLIAFVFLLGGHALLALAAYVAAGAAWVRHDRQRPLEEMPPWVSGGRLVAALIWALWPLRCAEAAVHWRRRLRHTDRFTVGPGRGADAFATWEEALETARRRAGETGQPVPVTDHAWLVRNGPGLSGPRRHWTGLVTPDGSVEQRPRWLGAW
jgi:hypothetical protein